MRTLATIVSALILLASCSTEDRRLYVYNWSYYTPEEVIASFEKEYGCDVVLDYFASNEEMFSKFLASPTMSYDIVFPSGDYVSIMKKMGMLQKIDHSKVPNLKYITPLVQSKADFDPGFEYSVPYFMGAAGIAVHKDYAEDYPESWSIFSDSSLKGRMCMMDDKREVLGAALSYLGYSVNTTDEAELEQAFTLINTQWKPNLAKFDAEGFAKSFASREYYAAHGYAEAFFEEIPEDEWDEIDFFIPEEGGAMYIDCMVVPIGADHYDLAMEFINYICDPVNYAKFLDRFHFPSSTNTEAWKYMKEEPFYTVEMLENCEAKNDVGEYMALYDDIWERIRYV